MKTSKIIIRSLYGITEQELTGASVELTGKKGSGKTSVLDAIRFALTNTSRRDFIIKNGENEGEIIVETDSGLRIDRKCRAGKPNKIVLKDNGLTVPRPESFLRTVFTPLQLDPVRFISMSPAEQNRAILDLIQYDWDLETIRSWFGEIPQGVNYEQNILAVLNEIQSEEGVYFLTRQDLNRQIRVKSAFAEEIARDLPPDYDAERWENYDTAAHYEELLCRKQYNEKIADAKEREERARGKLRLLETQRDLKIESAEKEIAAERETLKNTITRFQAEIAAAEEKIRGLAVMLSDRVALIRSEYETEKLKTEQAMGVAARDGERQPMATEALTREIDEAERMKKHLNEYRRMIAMRQELRHLQARSDKLTEKIELARRLPAEILKTAKIPIEGLTVENGIPLIHGLPISNRSDGELLELCVEIALHNPAGLKMILIDGTEKLDDESRQKLYQKCREKGLQFIATRTTNDGELVVTEL
ncbi:MAG: AAA family ATPase [Clostridia bacterium]|nr:AAA family ATPase [Clostridia bacterium]